MKTRLFHIVLLIGFCGAFLVAGNGIMSLTNPDEVFYVQTAKEMADRHEWFTPFLFDHPQFEKPIMLYWLLRVAFEFLGITSFSARLFPAIFGAIGVVAMYLLGLLGFGCERKAFASALVLASSLMYVGLARTVFTDIIFAVLILLSLLSFYWGYSRKTRLTAGVFISFAFAGLATLTKGPLGLLLPFLTAAVFLLVKKETRIIPPWTLLGGLAIFMATAAPWYTYETIKHGSAFMDEFFYNDHIRRFIEAEHRGNDTWYFYPASILGGMFPWTLVAIPAMVRLFRMLKQEPSSFCVFLATWICVVFWVFQMAHSKLISYVAPLFPAIALVIADFLVESSSKDTRAAGLFAAAISTSAFILIAAILLVVGAARIETFLPLGTPGQCVIFFAAAMLAIVAAVTIVLARRGRLLDGAFTMILVVPVLLATIGSLAPRLEPYVSSSEACRWLKKFDPGAPANGTFLSSKHCVRGVRYYTGSKVAIMDFKGRNFFSPHPIAFLTTEQELVDFLSNQSSVTYCFFKESAVKDLTSIPAVKLRGEVLNVMGNTVLMRINAP